MKNKKIMMCICTMAMYLMSVSNTAFAAGLNGDFDLHSSEINDMILPTNIGNFMISENNAASNSSVANSTFCKKTLAGTVSDNIQTDGYNGNYHASAINSYLYEWKGNLYRLEYTSGKVILEKYDSSYNYIGKGEIKTELPIFGGFYAGKDYNFIVFGDKNLSEKNDKEVIRVVKYTKGMNRVSSKNFYGCNTYIPFDAGCTRMDEYNGILYIHSSHEMYKSSDGYHHQANMDFYLRISDLSTVFNSYKVSNPSTGYMSHSFNQFIRVNENGIYTADHGDAYNRAITAFRRSGTKNEYAGYEDVFKIKGKIGENYTGVCVGGMELGENNMLIAGISVPQDSSYGKTNQKNLFIVKVPLYNDGKTSVKYLTDYSKSDNVTFSEPKLVKTSSDSFMLLWTETKSSKTRLFAAMLDGNGQIVGKIYEFNGKLSDCQPIIYNDRVTYYVTENGTPTFYYFDSKKIVKK